MFAVFCKKKLSANPTHTHGVCQGPWGGGVFCIQAFCLGALNLTRNLQAVWIYSTV